LLGVLLFPILLLIFLSNRLWRLILWILVLFGILKRRHDRLPLPPQSLTLLTYNVHYGHGLDGRLDPVRQAKAIKDLNPDIVAIQELDDNTSRCPLSLVKELSERTGMEHFIFAKAYTLTDGGGFGNGFLSKYQLLEVKEHQYEQWGDRQTRGAVAARIHPPQLSKDIWVISTHLQHDISGREQHSQARELLAFIDNLTPKLDVIVCGDLNSLPFFNSVQTLVQQGALVDVWKTFGDKTNSLFGTTFPAKTPFISDPLLRLDYIFVNRLGNLKCHYVSVMPQKIASDHRPILGIFYEQL